ncbi:MAG: FHA domain-containing protein, partial [Lacisediminihabitans sp.]
ASSAWDTSGRGRSWADRAARTVVVSVPPRSVRRAGVAHQPQQQIGLPTSAAPQAGGLQPGVPQPGALLPGVPAQTMPPIHPLPTQAEPDEQAPAPPAPAQAVQAQPAPTQQAPVQEAPVVLAAPQVISTSGRHAIVDEDSASASATGVGGQAFIGSPVPFIETPPNNLFAGIVPTDGADAASPDGTLLLIFDTGQREQLASPVSVNLGRNPGATEPGDKLIIVDDPESSVSKTHLRLEHSRGRTWLIDGNSTNGTELLSDDGEITVLAPGERVLLDDGVRVRIGNRTFTVSLLLGSQKAS